MIFAGAYPGTSAYINPTGICYDSVGVYDVTLIATSTGGLTDTLILKNYIHVLATPPNPIISLSVDTLISSIDPTYTSYQWYLGTTAIPGETNLTF